MGAPRRESGVVCPVWGRQGGSSGSVRGWQGFGLPGCDFWGADSRFSGAQPDLLCALRARGHRPEAVGGLRILGGSLRGPLTKMGGRIKTWRRRWFHLDPQRRVLAYYGGTEGGVISRYRGGLGGPEGVRKVWGGFREDFGVRGRWGVGGWGYRGDIVGLGV